MILEEIIGLLEAGMVGRAGKSLFINQFPASAKMGILLFPPNGGFQIEPEVKGYFHSEFELVSRAPSASDAMKLADRASAALDVIGKDTPGLFFKYCRPNNTPYLFPVSEGDYYEASVVFSFACNVKPII